MTVTIHIDTPDGGIAMLALSNILGECCMILEMRATEKKEAVKELVTCLVRAGKINDPGNLVEEILAQEKLITTGIGDGIAIPHKLTRRVTQTVAAFGRKKAGLSFDALDSQPVYLMFLILGPPGKPAEHLQLLSKLSRLLHDHDFRNALLNAQSPAEVLQAVRKDEMVTAVQMK